MSHLPYPHQPCILHLPQPTSAHLGQAGNKLGVTEGLVVAHVGVDTRRINQERLGEGASETWRPSLPRPREVPSRDVNTPEGLVRERWRNLRAASRRQRPSPAQHTFTDGSSHTHHPPKLVSAAPTSKRPPISVPATPSTLPPNCGHPIRPLRPSSDTTAFSRNPVPCSQPDRQPAREASNGTAEGPRSSTLWFLLTKNVSLPLATRLPPGRGRDLPSATPGVGTGPSWLPRQFPSVKEPLF